MCIYIVALEKQTFSYQKVGKLVEKTGELGRLQATTYRDRNQNQSFNKSINNQPNTVKVLKINYTHLSNSNEH